MNVFCIPSWYPSPENPLYGIFIKEQVLEIAKHHPNVNVGISYWGQGSNKHLLWAKDHLLNIPKIIAFQQLKPNEFAHSNNCREYYTPALTWTRRLLKGNRKKIVDANLNNAKRFMDQFGNIDVIHAQATYPAGLIAESLSASLSVPFIVTVRMSPFPFNEFLHQSGSLKSIISRPLSSASKIIAISKSLEKTLHTFGFKNTSTIHNLVRTDFFKPANIPLPKTFTFLSVGRMVRQKGFDILIKAISDLDEINATFEIVGSGPEKQNLQAMARRLNCQSKIDWFDDLDRSDLRDKIQRSHCLILPSRHETFGNVLVESLACGKPVIATDCGGPEDIINDANGLLAKVEDAGDLKVKIKDMMEKHAQFDVSGIRHDTEQRFSPIKITSKIMDIYREVQ